MIFKKKKNIYMYIINLEIFIIADVINEDKDSQFSNQY